MSGLKPGTEGDVIGREQWNAIHALRAMAECKVKEGIVAGAMAANARGAELGELLGKDD